MLVRSKDFVAALEDPKSQECDAEQVPAAVTGPIQAPRPTRDRGRRHEVESGIYIRPMCVIQVERASKEQHKPGYVHTDDVREYPLQHPASPRNTSPSSSPNPASRTGLTQLVGRILRQPYACKTGVPLLDESYVFCFRRRARTCCERCARDSGLRAPREGPRRRAGQLGRWSGRYGKYDHHPAAGGVRTVARDFVLPAFMIEDVDGWRLVHYERTSFRGCAGTRSTSCR